MSKLSNCQSNARWKALREVDQVESFIMMDATFSSIDPGYIRFIIIREGLGA